MHDSHVPWRAIALSSIACLLLAVPARAVEASESCATMPARKLVFPGKLKVLSTSMDVDGFRIGRRRVDYFTGRGWTVNGVRVDPFQDPISLQDEKGQELGRLVFHGSIAEIQVLDSIPQLKGEPRTKWQTAAKFVRASIATEQSLTFHYYELGSARRERIYDLLYPPVPARDRIIQTVHLFRESGRPLKTALGPPAPSRRAPASVADEVVIDPEARETAYESDGCRSTPSLAQVH
jgi:hypothetical protein